MQRHLSFCPLLVIWEVGGASFRKGSEVIPEASLIALGLDPAVSLTPWNGGCHGADEI